YLGNGMAIFPLFINQNDKSQMMKQIAVIGSGTMGNEIDHVFAQHKFKVALIYVNPTALSKALNTIQKNDDRQVDKVNIYETQKEILLQNITTHTDLEAGVNGASLVVEAATENEALKLKIFEQLSKFCAADTILASNTSSISITRIAAATSNPERVIGM